jgi:hypothetical protein
VAHDVSGQPYHEPKDIDHAVRRTLPSGRMAFVARTGQPGVPRSVRSFPLSDPRSALVLRKPPLPWSARTSRT